MSTFRNITKPMPTQALEMICMKFREEKHISEPYKRKYLKGLNEFVRGLEQQALQSREAV